MDRAYRQYRPRSDCFVRLMVMTLKLASVILPNGLELPKARRTASPALGQRRTAWPERTNRPLSPWYWFIYAWLNGAVAIRPLVRRAQPADEICVRQLARMSALPCVMRKTSFSCMILKARKWCVFGPVRVRLNRHFVQQKASAYCASW